MLLCNRLRSHCVCSSNTSWWSAAGRVAVEGEGEGEGEGRRGAGEGEGGDAVQG